MPCARPCGYRACHFAAFRNADVMSNNVNRDIDILKPFLRHRAISAGFTERELKSRAFTQLVWSACLF